MKKFNWHSNTSAFSLVELMSALMISLIIISAVFGAVSIGRTSWATGTADIILQQEARRALSFMTSELKQATSVSVPTPGQIDFSVAGIGNIRYSLSSNQINRVNPAAGLSPDGQAVILANNISSLNFQFNTDQVTITITAQRTTFLNRQLELTVVGNVFLRNI